jgi:hypothetical protein
MDDEGSKPQRTNFTEGYKSTSLSVYLHRNTLTHNLATSMPLGGY